MYGIMTDYLNLSLSTASRVLGYYFGIANVLGRLLISVLPDHKISKRLFAIFYLISLAGFCFCQTLLIWFGPNEFGAVAVLETVSGFMMGVFFAAMPIVIAEMCEEQTIFVIGWATFTGGIGSLLGPVYSGNHKCK